MNKRSVVVMGILGWLAIILAVAGLVVIAKSVSRNRQSTTTGAVVQHPLLTQLYSVSSDWTVETTFQGLAGAKAIYTGEVRRQGYGANRPALIDLSSCPAPQQTHVPKKGEKVTVMTIDMRKGDTPTLLLVKPVCR